MKLIKLLALIAVLLLIIILIGQIIFNKLHMFPNQIKTGVTFSPKYVTDLKLDWKDTYLKVLQDLKVKNLRIPSYWDVLEEKKDQFDYSQVDFMVDEANKNKAQLIVVLGERQPRWPECHIPVWARTLTVSDRQQRILEFIEKVVSRYKSSPEVTSWQIENEPFLASFGTGCDIPDEQFLKSEIKLVRGLSGKPIILTDSGELGNWIVPMQLSDVFGITLYRDVYNHVLGYTTFPLLPYFYNLKSTLVRNLFAQSNKKTIIIELQTEPWSPENNLFETPINKQAALFPLEKFKQNINFAKDTGFDEDYLWGVEWWYFMAQYGHPEYLDFAKSLFSK